VREAFLHLRNLFALQESYDECGREEKKMSLKLYLIISGAIFFFVGLFHLLRLHYDWPVIVGTTMIPNALSYIGCPVSLGYAVWAFWLLLGKSGRRPTESDLIRRGQRF
jgi:hypothetical protein